LFEENFGVIPQSQEPLMARLDLQKIFERDAPLQVDLGCGDGSFICALAERMPEKNFLGIERLLGRIRGAARKAEKVGNVRLLRLEISYAVRYLLSAGSVETFYLLFPDPWPKRRHHGRRVVTPDFLRSIHTALEKNGAIYIATDHLDYFEKTKKIAGANPDFVFASPGVLDLPVTQFERQFRAQGAAVHWLELRKISPVR
jgi:tRNA (guanine-N7-)-methyltransferase